MARTAEEPPVQPTPDEVAVLVRRSTNTLRHWRLNRIGPPSFRSGRRVFYDKRDVVLWLDEQKRTGSHQKPWRLGR